MTNDVRDGSPVTSSDYHFTVSLRDDKDNGNTPFLTVTEFKDFG